MWEWHKRSLRVNTRLQRESAINTIHIQHSYLINIERVISHVSLYKTWVMNNALMGEFVSQKIKVSPQKSDVEHQFFGWEGVMDQSMIAGYQVSCLCVRKLRHKLLTTLVKTANTLHFVRKPYSSTINRPLSNTSIPPKCILLLFSLSSAVILFICGCAVAPW